MDGAEAKFFYNWHQDRRCKKCTAGVVHEHAKDYHKQVYHHQYTPAVVRHGVKNVEDHLGQVHIYKHAAEHLHGERQQHYGAGGFGRINEAVLQCVPGEFFVDKESHGNGIGCGDCGSLGGGGNAPVNAAQDDEGHKQSPEGAMLVVSLAETLLFYPSRFQLLGGESLYLGVVAQHEESAQGQQYSQDDPGHSTGQEAGQDRGRTGPAVEYHNAAGWNKYADDAGAGHHCCHKAPGIAFLLEHGSDNAAYGGEGGGSAAGDGGENGAGNNANYCQPAFKSAYKTACGAYDLFAYASVGHNGTGHDEQRYSQQDDGAGVLISVGHEQGETGSAAHSYYHCAEEEGQSHRHSNDQEDEQHRNCKYDCRCHFTLPPSSVACSRASGCWAASLLPPSARAMAVWTMWATV